MNKPLLLTAEVWKILFIFYFVTATSVSAAAGCVSGTVGVAAVAQTGASMLSVSGAKISETGGKASVPAGAVGFV